MRSVLLMLVMSLIGGCNGGGNGDRPGIADVQGRGSDSPLVGRAVTITGIVTGDFQDADDDESSNLGGFFVQSVSPDDDPTTSEGVFVFDRNPAATAVTKGDRVRIEGTVVEQFGETQIEAASVSVLGSGEVQPVELLLPAENTVQNSDGETIADLERYEGMLVSVPSTLYVQDLHTLERHGDIVLSTLPREMTYTSLHEPDTDGITAWQEQRARRSLVLDDGIVQTNRQPMRYLFPDDARPDWSPRVGDALEGLLGVLRYSRGSGRDGRETWRLMPVSAPRFISRNPRLPAPVLDAELSIASFNVLNLFETIDRGSVACGPDRASRCRGADSAQEVARQSGKAVTAIGQLGADIVGLMEIENGTAISALVDALNAAAPGNAWAFVDTGFIGDDAIRVALIYRQDRVVTVGDYALLDDRVDARFNADKNRPALAQTFRTTATGDTLTVAVNHLKSKGSPCDDVGDPDRHDGQGNCNETRRLAAVALAAWLARDPTQSGDADFLIIGDLNAYRNEDPIRALEQAGLINLLAQEVGDRAYSFVFRGRSGALDHAFASPSLARQVSGVSEWHINADEPPVFDYNLEGGRNPGLFRANEPWRASDHDPLLIGLTLGAGQDR